MKFSRILGLLFIGAFLRIVIAGFVTEPFTLVTRLAADCAIIVLGVWALLKIAQVIESTTDVLQERTHLAGGLLQSFGTAFPDMVIGIVAALVSVSLFATNYTRAINFAIVAAAATFGSNIYNISYSAWCIWRQNQADAQNRALPILPFFTSSGDATPIARHSRKPSRREFDVAIQVLVALTLLTMVVAVSMVLFGYVKNPPGGFERDLYQLVRPVGALVFLIALGVLFFFRKNHREQLPGGTIIEEERYYMKNSTVRIWFDLALAGVAIVLVAESMVRAIESFAEITHIPFVIMGGLAGVIGCLGEMITIHQFIANPKGRIGDAIVGVAMDNIVTILGASIVALLGGIFLGGNALILIFVLILTANTLLIAQIARLKDSVA